MKNIGNDLARFLMVTIFLVLLHFLSHHISKFDEPRTKHKCKRCSAVMSMCSNEHVHFIRQLFFVRGSISLAL